MNKPVAYVNSMCNDYIDWKIEPISIDGQPLYTHPVKENYMDEVLNNTLNIEKNHNEKAYKELYEVCVKQQAEIEALKAHSVKELTDEEINQIVSEKLETWNTKKAMVDFARAILRKAQEK